MNQHAAIRTAREAALINEELAPLAEAEQIDDDSWQVRFIDQNDWVIARVTVSSDGACQFAA